MDKKPENIDGETKFLNRKGWQFVTYYKSTDSERAYNLAVEKSKKIERETACVNVKGMAIRFGMSGESGNAMFANDSKRTFNDLLPMKWSA